MPTWRWPLEFNADNLTACKGAAEYSGAMHVPADSKVPKQAEPVLGQSSTAPPSLVTPYHWLVVILAASGWLFDCMGQRIFVLSREPALRELLGAIPILSTEHLPKTR